MESGRGRGGHKSQGKGNRVSSSYGAALLLSFVLLEVNLLTYDPDQPDPGQGPDPPDTGQVRDAGELPNAGQDLERGRHPECLTLPQAFSPQPSTSRAAQVGMGETNGVMCEDDSGGETSSEQMNSLSIVPIAKNRIYQRALGKSSVFTCTANVEFPEKLNDFRWWWPDGRAIEATDTRVEIMRDQAGSLTLLFTSIQEQDLGTYRCTATYTMNSHSQPQQLKTDFTLRAFVPITFEDAPTNQYAVKGRDYKVQCRVRADPEPQVDWKMDHRVINNSEHFFIQKDGVIIRSVSEQDEGVYTCRVRVTSMGTVEERHIQVEVHELPKLTSNPEEVEGVESESVTLQCSATGKPSPEYEWVNDQRQDLRMLERYTVDKYSGILKIDGVTMEDVGIYICTAKNAAGYVTMKSTLSVVTRPVIEEFKNVTSQTKANAILTCRATGDPAPDIKFHKIGNRNPFEISPHHDARIFVNHKKEEGVTTATLKITDVTRNDDGLYSCVAYNNRARSESLGHLTVEFPPTFLNTPMREAWSWDSRPVNLSCVAEAIPNATITWFIEGPTESSWWNYTGMVDQFPNMKQSGSKSFSSLEIHPTKRVEPKSYRGYKCVATNKLGLAEHRIQLREARKPGPMLEAIINEKTATSIAYKLIGPVEDGGLPIKAFVAQLRKNGATWETSEIKSWPVNRQIFVINNLESTETYYVRFAAENEVGLGDWALEKKETLPKKSAPDAPIITNEVHGVAITAYPDRFELIWKIPSDNGEEIFRYEITYTPVRNVTIRIGIHVKNEWEPVGRKLMDRADVKPAGSHRHVLRKLSPDTFYLAEVRAQNKVGLSSPGKLVFKTANMPGDAWRPLRSPVKSSSAIVTTSHITYSISISISLLLSLFRCSFS